MPVSETLLIALLGVASIGLALGLVQLLPARLTDPLLPPSKGGPGGSRLVALDGLRAFLALGVVLQHAWIFRNHYFSNHAWVRPLNPFVALAGSLAVPVFFMITGYLFWNKAIAAKGHLKVVSFYLSRARRILPLYYFFCAAVFAIVLVISQGEPGTGSRTVVSELLSLVIPGYQTSGRLLGVDREPLMGHVWTLYDEVYFYLFFPLLAWGARTRTAARTVVGIFFLLLVFKRLMTGITDYPLFSFLAGIGTAELLTQAPRIVPLLRSPIIGFAVLAIIFCLPLLSNGNLHPLVFGGGTVSFVAIAAGNDLLGLLSLRSAQVIGQISYSVYLLHLPVLFAGLHSFDSLVPIAGLGSLAYTTVMIGAIVLVLGTAMATYRWVEKPWLSSQHQSPQGSVLGRRQSLANADAA
jgi:peptidoglycan/LPS O-acetylase OafA/YrhL